MSRNKELAKNTTFFIIGSLGAKVVNFVMLPLYTIWLSPSDYGVVDLIYSYNNILLMFVGLGIGDALVVFPIGKEIEEIKQIFSTALIFHLFSCILFFFLFWYVDNFIAKPYLGAIANYIWLMFAVLIGDTTSRLFQYFCRGIKKMSVFSFTGIISSVMIALCGFLLIPRFGVIGYIMASLIASMTSLGFIISYSKAYQYWQPNLFSAKKLKEMLAFCIPLIPNILMWWFILSMNRPILEKTVGIAAVGLFAIANKVPDIIGMFYGFFHQAWIVTAVEEYKKNDFSSYFNKVLKILTCLQCCICLLILLFGKILFDLLIDDKYSSALLYVPLLCVSMLFSNTSTFIASIFSANKHTKYLFYSIIFVSLTAAVLNFTLIPIWGIWGACLTLLFAQIMSVVSRVFFSVRFVKISGFTYHLMSLFICVAGAYIFTIDNSLLKNVLLVSISCAYFFYNKPLLSPFIKQVNEKIIKKL